MDLVIDRESWLRGEGNMRSYLLRTKDGKKCCLGFLGLALGVDRSAIADIANPTAETVCASWLFKENGDFSDDASEAMFVNDYRPGSPYESCPVENETDREARLTALFAKHNIALTFTGEA